MKRRSSGQIIKLDRGRWRIRWGLGRDSEGKRRTASEVVHGTKKDVEKRLAEIQGPVEHGVRVTTRGRTVQEMLEAWRAAEADQGRSKRTWHSYDRVIENHLIPSLGHLRVDDLRPTIVESQLLHPLAEPLARQAAKGEGPCLLVRRTLANRDIERWQPDAPVFNAPKTAAGGREIPLPEPLVRMLRGLRARPKF